MYGGQGLLEKRTCWVDGGIKEGEEGGGRGWEGVGGG